MPRTILFRALLGRLLGWLLGWLLGGAGAGGAEQGGPGEEGRGERAPRGPRSSGALLHGSIYGRKVLAFLAVGGGVSETLSWSRPRAATEARRPWVDALVRGAWAGAWTVSIGVLPVGLLYYLRWRGLELPWLSMGLELASFTPVCGASFGAGIALGLSLSRDRRWARPLLGALSGALFGILPGAFGAAQFGSKHAPYMGTAELLFAGAVGFFLFGGSLLVGQGVRRRHAIPALLLSLAPLGLLTGAAVALLPELSALGNDVVFEAALWMESTVETQLGGSTMAQLALFGALFGALIGGLFGGLVGGAYALVPGPKADPLRRG